MNETDFLKHFTANASQLMWFLGAGTSRTAGMPTATDIIWDLKLKYYCREENQDIKNHDINNEKIRERIQSYMISRGYPALWSAEEYSFYFDLTFGSDYAAQQKYLTETLSTSKISLNIGHRALAGLLALDKAKIIFTTNFDEVIETAYARVSGNALSAFHLEGAYAALNAYNNDSFPLYAKIHGDFKYQKVKNLKPDLLHNDQEIQKCFLAATSRYGIVVSGYSGRDENVMQMFDMALSQPNAFSAGLLWTVTSIKNVPDVVLSLIEKAKSKGINAHIVETGTFDSMMSKIWRQCPGRSDEIDKKVRTATTVQVNIPMGNTGNAFPVLRLNALPIISVPDTCALIKTHNVLSMEDVKTLVTTNKSKAQISRTDKLLGFGSNEEIKKALGENQVKSIEPFRIEEVVDRIIHSTGHHSFFERALAKALVTKKPLRLVNDYGWVVTIVDLSVDDPRFNILKDALSDRYGNKGSICGAVPNAGDTRWSEAVGIKLAKQNGKLWLTLTPLVWIEPRDQRQNHKDFTKAKTIDRHNTKASKIMDAWISILFESAKNSDVEITCGANTEFPATFKINTRTAYSRR